MIDQVGSLADAEGLDFGLSRSGILWNRGAPWSLELIMSGLSPEQKYKRLL